MAFPHLPWHFDLAFSSLVLKCSSNSLGGLIRGSENRISSAEELFDWLPPSASLTVFISWLSITISVIDLIESVGVAQVFFQRLMVSERRRSTMIHTDETFSRDLCGLLQTKNATLNFPRRIEFLVWLKQSIPSTVESCLNFFQVLALSNLWQAFFSVDSFLYSWLSFSRKCIDSTSFWKYKNWTSVPFLAFWIRLARKSSLFFF